ncbi:MAG TPA: hypothetical protein VHA75_11490 [Rugosimonospora sp.]|nr:hypothetical protein [Rugosimonospora sp.]
MRWRFWRRWADCPRATAAAQIAAVESRAKLAEARQHRPVVDELAAALGRIRATVR